MQNTEKAYIEEITTIKEQHEVEMGEFSQCFLSVTEVLNQEGWSVQCVPMSDYYVMSSRSVNLLGNTISWSSLL